jgi:hypothetical protein
MWEEHLQRVKELASLDTNRQVFASFQHRYHFGMKLWDAAIAPYEQRLGITIPDEYRSFLIECGDGGPGPYYGIYTLERALGEDRPELISKPFELEKDFDLYREQAGELSHPEHERRRNENPAYRAQCDEIANRFFAPETRSGTIAICEYGCGGFFRLVVSGDQYGRIWFFDDNGAWDLDLDLCELYGNWLDFELHKLRTNGFGVASDPLEYGRAQAISRKSLSGSSK